MMTPELQLRIEERFLAQEDELRMALLVMEQPTVDQHLSAMEMPFTVELSWQFRDYLVRSMVVHLADQQDQPKILFEATVERFGRFLLDHCEIEEWVSALQRLKHFEVKLPQSESIAKINDTVKALLNDTMV